MEAKAVHIIVVHLQLVETAAQAAALAVAALDKAAVELVVLVILPRLHQVKEITVVQVGTKTAPAPEVAAVEPERLLELLHRVLVHRAVLAYNLI